MAYRKKTLRQMLPVTRKVARLRGELTSIDRRLAQLVLSESFPLLIIKANS